MKTEKQSSSRIGFTIVELLIVIVVIAILAAIVIIAYNGIQLRAKASAAQSAASQASKKIMSFAVQNADVYPTTLTQADVRSGGGTTFTYSSSSASPRRFCLTATVDDISYFQTSNSEKPVVGDCSGLIAWWSMDGDGRDRGGSQLNATVNGATLTSGQSGEPNGAYQLGSTSQNISIGTSSSYSSIPSAFSYSLWLARSGASTYEWPSIFGAANTHVDFGLKANNFGQDVIFEWGTSPFAGTYTGTSTIISLTNTNEWHHVAVTLYGGTLRTYADGVLRTTTNSVSLRPVMASMSVTTPANGWVGKVDDVRLYDRPLSDAEIDKLYQAGAQ